MVIRSYLDSDAAACVEVYYRAVHDGAGRHYTAEQRHAWAPEPPDHEVFGARLAAAETFVAERDSGVVGFVSLTSDGYVDLFFVLPEEMGKGISDALYAMIVNRAGRLSLTQMTTHASHLARSFFLRHGWVSDEEETVIRHGVALKRTAMSFDRQT